MNNDRRTPGPETPRPAKKVYRAPEIIEWGSVVDLTNTFLNGLIDPTFGGSVPGFREPPPFPPRSSNGA